MVQRTRVVYKIPKNKWWKMVGSSLLLASIQASISSNEMSSRFSVINFAKDQATLNNAANSLTGYLLIAMIWTAGACMISYGQYGKQGLISCFIANMLMIGWVFGTYCYAFYVVVKQSEENHARKPSVELLKYPPLFSFKYSYKPPEEKTTT
jgi:beta-lactamase regulating signal transducer with metallopeptidase domain